MSSEHGTGWRRLIGSPKLQIIFHKRATKYRSLLRKMTYEDKGSYESSPPCTIMITHYDKITSHITYHAHTHTHTHSLSLSHTHIATHAKHMGSCTITWVDDNNTILWCDSCNSNMLTVTYCHGVSSCTITWVHMLIVTYSHDVAHVIVICYSFHIICYY